MNETDESPTCNYSNQKRVCIAYFLRLSTGLLLIIISSVAASYKSREITEEYGSVFPYFVGGFVTGITMTFSDFVNYRIWVSVYRGTITSKQEAQWVRSGALISVLSVIFAIISSILDGVYGIQTPHECRKYQYLSYHESQTCTELQYQQTNTYKIAIVLLLMILFSIVVNTIYMCQPDPFQTGDFNKTGNRSAGDLTQQRETLVQTTTNSQISASGNSSSRFVQSTRHGQPEPFAGTVLSTGGQQPVSSHVSPNVVLNTRRGQPQPFAGAVLSRGDHRSLNNHGPSNFVLNTRHGEPEPFEGAVLSRRDERPVNSHGPSNFVLNTHHGQPEPFAGAILSSGQVSGGPSGFVLNSRHGQPEPFAGAILSTDEQPQVSLNNLVFELQEQNRLLREQLAIQQQQHQPPSAVETATPSAPISESPPSYDSLMSSR